MLLGLLLVRVRLILFGFCLMGLLMRLVNRGSLIRLDTLYRVDIGMLVYILHHVTKARLDR